MGALRTIICSTLASLGAALGPVATSVFANPEDPGRLFAICAGRLSATMEHQWLVDGPASERTKVMRDEMVDLLLATAQPGQDAILMGWRIEAKAAHAALLSQGAFPKDGAIGPRAMKRADQLLADCVRLILPQS